MPYMRTMSGRNLLIREPDIDHLDIEDIAHALSMQCRFAGQIPHFYSVAQHCVLVSQICDPRDAFWGLMHDAAEAYTGDIISPIKSEMLEDYRRVEGYFMEAICRKFNLDTKMPPSVHSADFNAYLLEEDNLRKNNAWPSGFAPDWAKRRVPILPLQPWFAKQLFLQRFKELTK